MAVTVLWGPEEHARTRSAKLFGQICADVNEISSRERTSGEDPGDAVVRISRVIIADLQQLLSSLHAAVQKEMAEIESAIFHKQYQSMSAKAGLKYEQISRLKFEILSISSTISETQNVFKAVSKGDVVIRAPFVSKDSDVPPFSAEQRIWIADLLMRARSLKAQRNGLEEEVRLLYERLESLENRRQTAAQMRFAAVASILLLPALVVGFFGQNFNINPWSESEWAWEISAGLLAVLAVNNGLGKYRRVYSRSWQQANGSTSKSKSGSRRWLSNGRAATTYRSFPWRNQTRTAKGHQICTRAWRNHRSHSDRIFC